MHAKGMRQLLSFLILVCPQKFHLIPFLIIVNSTSRFGAGIREKMKLLNRILFGIPGEGKLLALKIPLDKRTKTGCLLKFQFHSNIINKQ